MTTPHTLFFISAMEITPSNYIIQPVESFQFEDCELSCGGYYLCPKSSLLLDSIHGPQLFSTAALSQFYTQFTSSGRTVFRFSSEIHLEVVQLYYYLVSTAQIQWVTMTETTNATEETDTNITTTKLSTEEATPITASEPETTTIIEETTPTTLQSEPTQEPVPATISTPTTTEETSPELSTTHPNISTVHDQEKTTSQKLPIHSSTRG